MLSTELMVHDHDQVIVRMTRSAQVYFLSFIILFLVSKERKCDVYSVHLWLQCGLVHT